MHASDPEGPPERGIDAARRLAGHPGPRPSGAAAEADWTVKLDLPPYRDLVGTPGRRVLVTGLGLGRRLDDRIPALAADMAGRGDRAIALLEHWPEVALRTGACPVEVLPAPPVPASATWARFIRRKYEIVLASWGVEAVIHLGLDLEGFIRAALAEARGPAAGAD